MAGQRTSNRHLSHASFLPAVYSRYARVRRGLRLAKALRQSETAHLAVESERDKLPG